MPDSGLFRAFRLVFWLVSHPTRPLRNPRTEQNCLRPRKRPSVLQTGFYLALENFLFRSVMKLLGFSRYWCSWRSICWNTVHRTSMKAFQSIFKSKINRLVVLFGWGTLVSRGMYLSHRKQRQTSFWGIYWERGYSARNIFKYDLFYDPSTWNFWIFSLFRLLGTVCLSVRDFSVQG